MNNLNDRKLKLYESFINNNDVSVLMKAAYDAFENPVFIFDSSFFLINSIMDEDGSSLDMTNNFDFDNFHKNEELFINKIDTLKENDIVEFETENSNHNVIVKPIGKISELLGYVVIIDKNRPFTDDDKQLLIVASNIINKQLFVGDYSFKTNYYLLIKILDQTYDSKETIESLLASSDIKNFSYRLVMFNTNHQTLTYKLIVNKYPNSIVFMFNRNILLALDNTLYSKQDMLDLKEYLKNDVEDINISISETFESFVDLRQAYTQNEELMDLGKSLDPNPNLFIYEDFIMTMLLKNISSKQLSSLIDHRIKEMIEYDKQNNTSYVNDLQTYFRANRNINKAAEMMFVHKNSIYYRLTKIQEKFAIDLENDRECFVIESSLRTMELIEKMNTNN